MHLSSEGLTRAEGFSTVRRASGKLDAKATFRVVRPRGRNSGLVSITRSKPTAFQAVSFSSVFAMLIASAEASLRVLKESTSMAAEDRQMRSISFGFSLNPRLSVAIQPTGFQPVVV